MIGPCHTWNVQYNARSNRSHPPTLPNIVPATKKDADDDWSSSHMKRPVQRAEQQESPSNFTKYSACHEKGRWWLTLVTYETSSTMRGATGATLQHHQIWRLPRNSELKTSVSGKSMNCSRQYKDDSTIIRESRRRPYSSHLADAFCVKKYNIWRSGYLPKLQEMLPWPRQVTFQLHQTLRLPRKITLMIDPPDIWNVQQNTRSNRSHPPTSPNIAPSTKNDSSLLFSTLLYPSLLYYPLLYATLLYFPLLYTTLLYSTLLYYPLRYSTLLYYSLLYSTLLYHSLLFSTILYSTLLFSSLLFSTLLYSTLLYSTLPYPTLPYPTLLYSTLLYSTLLYSHFQKTPQLGSFSSKLPLRSVFIYIYIYFSYIYICFFACLSKIYDGMMETTKYPLVEAAWQYPRNLVTYQSRINVNRWTEVFIRKVIHCEVVPHVSLAYFRLSLGCPGKELGSFLSTGRCFFTLLSPGTFTTPSYFPTGLSIISN